MTHKALAVIFDMDGVLVDSYHAHFESWLALARLCGFEFTEQDFATTFGRTSRDIIAHFWGAGLPEQRIAEMDARKEALYRDIIARDFPAMDGARELIGALHEAGFRLAVGSSGPPENIEVTMQGLGLPDCFSATVTGQDVTRGKPDPQVFLTAAERLGVPPGRCAVVEDAPAGVEAANRAGMASVALTGTALRDKLAHADLVIDSLRELSPGVVAELIGRKGRAE
jgi:beta-phosphoglucomutase